VTLTVDRLRAAPRRTRTKRAEPRRDIQGLRALAVLVVISDHLFGWPAGGFIGVDVFFVISGFLITGLLYREHQATGRISFPAFYRRRARRILPIATAVLVVTVAASFALYLTSRAREIGVDAIWALLFSANWHFAAIGTNYLANDRFVSPVQHYWSLAVEEQFYLLWPLLLVAVLGVGLRRRWQPANRARALFLVMAAVTAASFGWALRETVTNPTWAYFSTFARGFELGLGAVLAVAVPTLRRIPDRARPILAWIGLLGIVGSLFLVTTGSAFPGPWAALPVLSTALVLAAGSGGPQRGLFPLTNAISNYLGNISYSLYLWHFPVIVLLALALALPRGMTFYPVAAGIIFALSVASYHGLEHPVHISSWLEPGGHRSQTSATSGASHRHSSSRTRRYLRHHAKQLAVLGVTMLLAGVAVAGAAQQMKSAQQLTTAQTSTGASVSSVTPHIRGTGPAEPTDLQTALLVQINTSLRATKFPQFAPPVDSLGIKKWSQEVAKGGCFDIDASNVASCASGTGKAGKDVAILGDSYAVAWLPGIRNAFESLGWKVHSLTEGQCPSISVPVTKDGGIAFPECGAHRRWALQQIAQLKPDLVILADADNTADRLASQARGKAADRELDQGTLTTLAAIKGHAAKTVVLSPPPAGVSLQDCVTRVSAPANCLTRISAKWRTFTDVEKAAAGKSKVGYIDTSRWFCNDVSLCPGFVGTMPIRADGSHLTVAYSQSLAPLLAQTILR
jgi:peptidoglycan/LPS O-acetylase OafA/YrhL